MLKIKNIFKYEPKIAKTLKEYEQKEKAKPKYKTEAQVKATTKDVDKRVLIKELTRRGVNGVKVYATFYK